MAKKPAAKQTPLLPPNQRFVDQNKAALRAVEKQLADKKQALAKAKRY